MNIDKSKYRLPQGKFFTDVHKKDMILLHFTAGSTTSGAFNSWVSQKIKIGTAYILDPNGTVYEIFDPKYWAYHLGITGPAAQNWKHDKRSVAIEIVNIGPLKLKDDTLYCWPKNYGQKFCNVSETGKYVKKSFRGFDYYAAYTPEQMAVLPELVTKIGADFDIPTTLPPVEKREVFDTKFFDNWKGITSHQNWRPDKFDVGAAFNWKVLE